MEDQPGMGFGLVGVAPEATLGKPLLTPWNTMPLMIVGMYRVFGCSGSGSSDIILQAMLQAAADGADVISMSLGSLVSLEVQDPFETVTTALVSQGIAVITANGNDGDYGIYAASAPGTGPSVFAVGSVDNEKFPVTYQLTDSTGRHMRYSAVLPLSSPPEGVTVQIMNYGGSLTELLGCYESFYADAAANLTAAGIDPSTVMLATLNGGCGSYSKGQVAKSYGFSYLLSYTTAVDTVGLQEFGDVDPEVYYNITPIVTNLADSSALLQSYGRHPLSYKVYFDNQTYAAESANIITGGLMSNYSSFGPGQNYDLSFYLKPQLSSPGGLILATWPLEVNGYAVISGTSMATPFMSGCYALVKSQYPDLTVNETYALLQNSGTQMAWYYDQTILSSAAHQGAGLVNVHNAINLESLVTPPQLTLGTSAQPVTAKFTIWNRSTRSKTYTFSHKAAGLMEEVLSLTNPVVNEMFPLYATASFPTPSVSVPAGQKLEVSVVITPPQNVSPEFRPIYTGFIIVHNNYETYSLPYVGQPWDNGKAGNSIALIAPVQIYPSEQIINELAPSLRPYANYRGHLSFTAKPDTTAETFSMGDYGFLGVLWATTQPTDWIRFDLVPANTSFVPDLYGYNPAVVSIPASQLIYPAGVNITYQTILGLDDVVEVLADFEGPFADAFQSEGFWWDNENALPDADYRVVMRVLPSGKVYEDPAAWDSWLSAIVRVNSSAEYVSVGPGSGLGQL
jgi:Subtilase family/Fn3-like domain